MSQQMDMLHIDVCTACVANTIAIYHFQKAYVHSRRLQTIEYVVTEWTIF